MLPAVSVWRTWNVCDPSATLAYAFGLVQALKPPPSSWHWNVAPASPVKEKDGAREFESAGGFAVIAGAAGGVRSIAQV